ncbi:hypothetical protein [Amycolatopsis alkalitolerans]|uniref:Uncharacterized protein n=1 Tax=Amycolatopsis alkalitolerans TaxID=2547244 RepID=A0A5C4LW98_9PSEU|nr:hypothetical protein [Amycolatopsis alkalitolerans]TNC23712.1 hypothetical protein FG385_20320 [Amycolatopsis alkalitolerans]
MGDVEQLVARFQALRDGDGLTIERLKDHENAELLDLLMTPDDPYAGLSVLDDLIAHLLDAGNAWALGALSSKVVKHAVPVAVRVALAIGNDDDGASLRSHGNLTQRREWACAKDVFDPNSRAFFMKVDVKTHRRYEDLYGFPALACLILRRAGKLNVPGEARRTEVLANGQSAPVALTEDAPTADDRDAPWWRRARSTLVTWIRRDVKASVALAVVMVAAVGTTTGILIVKNRSSQSPVNLVEAATVPSRAQVSTPPDAKIDNTRGWGPDRRTFTINDPAPYPVFNSITDLTGFGDERNFVQCHDLADKGKPGGGWGDDLIARDEHTYECMIFFDNDISPRLDSIATPSPFTEGNVAAKLQRARAWAVLPAPGIYNPGLVGALAADNSPVPTVWDSCNFISPRPVTIEYQADSTRMFTNDTPKEGVGVKSDTLTEGSVLLGNKQDGYLGQDGGYLLFNVHVSLS